VDENHTDTDLTGVPRDGATTPIDSCPSCGWPENEPYKFLSCHTTSEGTIIWSRCLCGRLRVHRGATVVARSAGAHRDW